MENASSQQSIAQKLREMECFEPLQLTAQELDAFEQAIRDKRKFELDTYQARAAKLEALFD